MELHAEERPDATADAFVRAVVDVHEPRLPIGRQRVVTHRVAVVLAGDIAAARQQILHGLVHPAVPVGKLVRVATGRQREDLIAQAHAEDRATIAAKQTTHLLDEQHQIFRIAWPVADQYPVCVGGQLRQARVIRRTDDGRAALQQAADDVVLRARIHNEDLQFTCLVVDRRARRDAAKYLIAHFDGARRSLCLVEAHFRREEPALHRAPLTQTARERPRVDARYRRHLFRAQPLAKRSRCRMVAVRTAVRLHDKSLNLNATRLEGTVECALLARRRHAVVADERIGGDEDLALVRGIGQRFDVPGHAGVEHDFAEYRAGFAKRGTFHLRAVLENELHARGLRWHRGGLAWIFSASDGLGCLDNMVAL